MTRLAEVWPPQDRLGRRQPHRFNLLSWRSIPGLPQQFDAEVPGEMIQEDVAEDGTPVATIPCTCGAEVEARLAEITECSGECGRWFANFGKKVKVARFEPDEEVSADS